MKKIIDFLEENGNVDAGNRKIIEYGIKRIRGCIEDFAVVILAAGILHIIWAGILFQISYMLLRVHAGGYHAPDERKCQYISFLCTLFCIGFIRYADVSAGVLLGISFVSAAGIYMDAPVESVNKPLSGKEKAVFGRRARIIAAIELICCFVFCCCHSYYFLRAVSISMAVIFLGVEIVAVPQKYRRFVRKKREDRSA